MIKKLSFSDVFLAYCQVFRITVRSPNASMHVNERKYEFVPLVLTTSLAHKSFIPAYGNPNGILVNAIFNLMLYLFTRIPNSPGAANLSPYK